MPDQQNTSALAEELRSTIETAQERLLRIDPAQTATRSAPGRWSQREILGHLVDSAVNNQQRFVRAQQSGALAFPGYDQDAWVSHQKYDQVSWDDLVGLWSVVNRHLVHVVLHVEEDALETPCAIGDDAPVTLRELIVDYIEHLRHHLAQIGV